MGGQLAAVLAQYGGATRVAAGGSFCAALCASGTVVVWGAVQGPAKAPLAASPESVELPHLNVFRQGHLLVAVVADLPPMVEVAAGVGHVLFSDGERVWGLGRSAGACAPGADAASSGGSAAPDDAAWLTPRELLRLPDARITALRAGGFASAAVSDDGRLYLWGRLLPKEAAVGLLEQAQAAGYGHWSMGPTGDAEVANWEDWPGLGAGVPTLVPGLSGVKDLALGTCHALAVVE